MKRVAPLLFVVAGLALGLATFTFVYAEGGSYLSNDPAACVNCHAMQTQYDAWMKGSHARVATCNDCHAPHSGLPAKLAAKAVNGFNHSLRFTTGRYPDPIRSRPMNQRITQAACQHCHQSQIHSTPSLATGQLSCMSCHDGVGHNTRN